MVYQIMNYGTLAGGPSSAACIRSRGRNPYQVKLVVGGMFSRLSLFSPGEGKLPKPGGAPASGWPRNCYHTLTRHLRFYHKDKSCERKSQI
jgi:hypothetical protein